jgi:molecular chaperone HtpG
LESKWDNLKLFIEYGMLSDEKFCERALDFALFKNTDGKYFSFDEYKKAIEGSQTDKDKKLVYLYATDPEAQYSYIEDAKNKGYDVLLMDCELDSHYVNLLEQKLKDSKFARVDSDSIGNLIAKEEKIRLQMSEADNKDLSEIFKAVLPKENEYYVTADNLGENEAPILITQSEFMRRYREMSAMGGGMNFYGQMPASYNITVNMQNPLVAKIMEGKKADIQPEVEVPSAPEVPKDGTEEEKKAAEEARKKADEAKKTAEDAHKADLDKFADGNEILHQIADLALLANGMLKGKALSDFIARSQKVVTEAYMK